MFGEDDGDEVRMQVDIEAEAGHRERQGGCSEGDLDPGTPVGTTQHRRVQGSVRGQGQYPFSHGALFR